MRDLFKKVMTGSMIAGAALLVSACGGGEDAAANNTTGNFGDEGLMGNDLGGVDAMNGTGNLGVDANVAVGGTTDLNTTSTTTNTTTTDTGTGNTTGTGTGNTTGM
jgi:hypothetical protein